MAFYKNMINPKKEKKHYTYGAEEGSRYNRESRNEKTETSRNAGKKKFSGDLSSGRRNYADRKGIQDRNGFPDERRAPHRKVSDPMQPTKQSVSYTDYEYLEKKQIATENNGEQDKYILTGRNPIREALKNHRDLEKLLVQKGELSGSAKEIVQKAKEQRVMVQVVDRSRLDEIAPQHQGLIAYASAYQYATVEDILAYAAKKGEDPFIVILDGITDPHNLGAIIRTAECAGAHGIIVPQHRSVGLTPAAVKASAGAVEYVKVARVTNLNRTIEDLQRKNIWIYALDMDGKDYMQISFDGGTALVIGAEGEGISRLTGTKCDEKVALPMKGHLDSLNASVAAGIIMYRVMSSRNK